MAITISGSPQNFQPVYNPIVYYTDSTNKTEDGFKYVADIYSAGTSNRIATLKVLPRPNDGLGVFNINQILENEVSYSIPGPSKQFQNAPLNFIRYDVEFGEEYFVNWDYSGVTRGPSIFSGFTQINGVTSNPFVNGNQVIVFTDTPAPGLEGFTSVFATGANEIVVNIPWNDSFSAATGFVRFANESKTIFPNLTASTGKTAFNGAVSHKDFINYDGGDYTLTGNTSQLLTNMPDYYRVKKNNNVFLQFHQLYNPTTPAFIPNFIEILTYEGDPRLGAPFVGEYFYSAATVSTTGLTMQMVNVGPDALENFDAPVILGIIGSLPIFKPEINFYRIKILSSLFPNPISTEYFFEINKDCFRFNNIELMFQDRLGSLIPANFEVNSIRRINWNQTTYDTYMGDLVGGKYNYNAYDRGTNIINTNVTEELEINSNWIEEDVADYWQELFTSPLVYIIENGQGYPVIIKDTTKEILTTNNKKNISYKLTIQYAFNNRVQNGK